mmetsp:Transcript_15165/g.36016  ORF Transcript_15165/g.36016 Transcript_15165/m.36016 type:complete len:205 (+) Transcript_15165:915-1529(+)
MLTEPGNHVGGGVIGGPVHRGVSRPNIERVRRSQVVSGSVRVGPGHNALAYSRPFLMCCSLGDIRQSQEGGTVDGPFVKRVDNIGMEQRKNGIGPHFGVPVEDAVNICQCGLHLVQLVRQEGFRPPPLLQRVGNPSCEVQILPSEPSGSDSDHHQPNTHHRQPSSPVAPRKGTRGSRDCQYTTQVSFHVLWSLGWGPHPWLSQH